MAARIVINTSRQAERPVSMPVDSTSHHTPKRLGYRPGTPAEGAISVGLCTAYISWFLCKLLMFGDIRYA